MFFKVQPKYKVRRSTAHGGREITVPPNWVKGELPEVEVLYDPSVVVILAPGIEIDEDILAKAITKKADSR